MLMSCLAVNLMNFIFSSVLLIVCVILKIKPKYVKFCSISARAVLLNIGATLLQVQA